ncbi:PREDICTED: cAMP-dependent protein kinase type II-alpha regulatory subunit-like [Galeopterus variegatus]|uniref:cAMP-dependent protein kinase type II-alpha regulatory subunit-like n=1 Tax=Galeopterus variegatus TaxID=482537 RepID=A0ABM0Q6N9_GALVR|nr:PREDICTED: cAMP-dependent protein kinase type II-alpha regulatory subunit-like [Galeopterus variegatus]
MSHIQIPPGLTELLQGYTVEVLRQQPPDLIDFAVDYFTRQREARAQASVPPAAPPSDFHTPEPGPDTVADANTESDSEDDADLEALKETCALWALVVVRAREVWSPTRPRQRIPRLFLRPFAWSGFEDKSIHIQ